MKKLIWIALVVAFVLAAAPVLAGDFVFSPSKKQTDPFLGYVIDTRTGQLWAVTPVGMATDYAPKDSPKIVLHPIPYSGYWELKGYKDKHLRYFPLGPAGK